jgi:hypothetical protein
MQYRAGQASCPHLHARATSRSTCAPSFRAVSFGGRSRPCVCVHYTNVSVGALHRHCADAGPHSILTHGRALPKNMEAPPADSHGKLWKPMPGRSACQVPYAHTRASLPRSIHEPRANIHARPPDNKFQVQARTLRSSPRGPSEVRARSACRSSGTPRTKSSDVVAPPMLIEGGPYKGARAL